MVRVTVQETVPRKVKEKVDTTKTLFVRNDRWVLVTSVVILFLSFLLVSLSGYVTNLRQEDVKQAMYTYEQQIFEKKIQIYREEYRVKGVHVTELENRIEIISKELQEVRTYSLRPPPSPWPSPLRGD